MSDEENTSFDSTQDLRPTTADAESSGMSNPEPNSVPVSPPTSPEASLDKASEPTTEAPIPPSPSDFAKATPDEQDKPLEPTPEPLEQPNITVEKNGNNVTITEVMESNSAEATLDKPTAQTARFEPFAKGNPAKQMRKRKKIDAILELFSPTPSRKTGLRGVNEVTNKDVQKTLHVSDATATRYLETLEKEGKIKQVGKTGRGVKYEKI